MKKILDIFDYVFYRLYKYFSSHRFFNGMEIIDAISTIVLTVFFPIGCIVGSICHKLDITIFERYSAKRYWVILGLFVVAYLPMMKRYMFNRLIAKGNFRIFRDRWGNEDMKLRKKRGWLITALIINSLVLIPLLLIVLEHYNIL